MTLGELEFWIHKLIEKYPETASLKTSIGVESGYSWANLTEEDEIFAIKPDGQYNQCHIITEDDWGRKEFEEYGFKVITKDDLMEEFLHV